MEELKHAIEHHGIYRCGPHQLFPALPGKSPNAWYQWQFYLRRVLLNPRHSRTAAKHLLDGFDVSNVQFAACEDAGVPLGYALADLTGLNLFTIKKTRKAYGLLNFTEGLVEDRPVILVDDVAGSTSTLKKAQALLKHFNLPTIAYFTLVNKNVSGHSEAYLDVPMVSCFTAEQFALTYDEYVHAYGREPAFGRWH